MFPTETPWPFPGSVNPNKPTNIEPPTGQDPNPDNWTSPTRPDRPDWRTHPEAYELWCQRHGSAHYG